MKHRAYESFSNESGIPQETLKQIKYEDFDPTCEQIEALAPLLKTRASYLKGDESPCFSDWILERRKTDSPTGDFIGDTQSNFDDFPKGKDATKENILSFLRAKSADKEAIQIFQKLWTRYKSQTASSV